MSTVTYLTDDLTIVAGDLVTINDAGKIEKCTDGKMCLGALPPEAKIEGGKIIVPLVWAPRTRYHFEGIVLSVEERHDTVHSNWRRDPNDPTQTKNISDTKNVSQGWFVRFTDSSAMFFGMQKPDFVKGDTLQMTVVKKVKS
jgi:hypothetical protein